MPEFTRRIRAGARLWALRELYRNFREVQGTRNRGLRLLREWLSPEQLAQFDFAGYFDVIGCDTGKRYRIRYGKSANVQEVDGADRLGVGWCFGPVGLVEGDVMLAQKIALETEEMQTLSIANSFPPLFGWRI